VHRPLLALALLTACAPSLHEIDRHNRDANADADAKIGATGAAFTPAAIELPLSAPVAAAAGTAGLEPGETIYRDGDQLVFASTACVRAATCGDGCAIPVRYTFHRAADRHLIVTRDRIREQIVKTVEDDTCPKYCGGGTPPAPEPTRATIPGSALGVGALGALEFRDVTRDVWIVDRICTNTQPIP